MFRFNRYSPNGGAAPVAPMMGEDGCSGKRAQVQLLPGRAHVQGEPQKSARKSHGLGAHLKVSGDEAGERELVDVGREAQAGPGRNFRGHGLGDAPIQGMVMAWG